MVEITITVAVQEFIESLPTEAHAKFLAQLALLNEKGHELGPPHAKPLSGTKLWELRTRQSGKFYRVLYFFLGGRIFLVRGFVKTTDKIPKGEIERAERMRKEITKENQNERR